MKRFFIVCVLLASMLYLTPCQAREYELKTCKKPLFMQTNHARTISATSTDDDLEEIVLKGWDELKEEIDVESFGIKEEDVGDVYWSIVHNNPLYYYIGDSFRYYVYDGTIVSFVPEYTETDKEKIKEFHNQIEEATDEILYYIDNDMTEFEKVMAVHDYMVLHYEYDESLTISDISIMITKTGVCQSYSYAFKHLMDELGIDCTFVASDEMLHSWNLVKVDGYWYHIDLTWDDPTHDKFGQVLHEYALLSTAKITTMEKPHYGFDLGELTADSTKYDQQKWHHGVSSIVHSSGKTYWFEEDDLVCSDGSVIFENIITDNKWRLGNGYYLPGVFAGLACRGDMLYFNGPDKIYAYDIKTGNTATLHTDAGICGLFIDRNTVYYTKYDMDAVTNQFVKGGEISLGVLNVKKSYRVGDKIYTKICHTEDTPIRVYAFDGVKTDVKTFNGIGVFTATFDFADKTDIFVWGKNMTPLIGKTTVQ